MFFKQKVYVHFLKVLFLEKIVLSRGVVNIGDTIDVWVSDYFGGVFSPFLSLFFSFLCWCGD
jgi:hypothetical protein